MAETLKVLVTDTAPLTPVRWGGPHRIFHLFSNLPERFDVTYVGLDLNATEPREKKVSGRLAEVIVAPSKVFPVIRKMQMRILKEESFDVYSSIAAHRDKPYREAVLKHAEDADILIASHPWGFPILVEAAARARREGKRKVLIYDGHNCEYTLTKQILASRPRLLAAPVLAEVRRIERLAVGKSHLVLACSREDEIEYMRHYTADSNKIRPLPNSVPLKKERTHTEKKAAREALDIRHDARIAFFVGAYYRPNIEALEAIITIAEAMPHFHFHIAGSVSHYPDFHPEPKEVPDNVVMHGVVDDEKLEMLLTAADLAINPNFAGGGIQIKMLDYFAAALPVVSTEHGARGLEVMHDEHLIIAEHSEFAAEIEELCLNPQRMERLGKSARKFVEELFSSEVLGNRLGEYLNYVWSNHTGRDVGKYAGDDAR